MAFRIPKIVTALTLGLVAASATAVQAQTANVLNFHNDLAGTGQNLRETVLTPDTVKSDFGLLFSRRLDPEVPIVPRTGGSQVYAQPLYVGGLYIPSRKRRYNVVFVATEHDSLYAFDADSNTGPSAEPLWHVSFLKPGVTTIPMPTNTDLEPEVGITGTPTIDLQTGTLYVVVRTKEKGEGSSAYHQRLHAIDIATGAEKVFLDPASGKKVSAFPVEITALVPGTGNDSHDGKIAFEPRLHNQRCGLTLSHGHVYIAWASHRDAGPYHGWILSYDARTGAQTAAFNATPNNPTDPSIPKAFRDGAGIWQSGAALTVDTDGSLYTVTGNGDFDPSRGDYGEAFLRLNPDTLAVEDYFVPSDREELDRYDTDLGSGGPLLFPDVAGSPAHPHLLLSGGKAGKLYLLDRDKLGRFHQDTEDTVQQIEVPQANGSHKGAGLYSMPAYFNGALYYVRTGEYLKRVPISGAHLGEDQTVTADPTRKFGFPGATVSISANGAKDGIVWATESHRDEGGNYKDHALAAHLVLHAYDAQTLTELFNSGMIDPVNCTFMKFNPPTVTNGHVYIGSAGSLLTFGLRHSSLPTEVTRSVRIARAAAEQDPATGLFQQRVTVTNTGKAPLPWPVSVVLEDLPASVSLSLDGSTGTTTALSPTGTFYADLDPGAFSGGLPSGQSAIITLSFRAKVASDIRYKCRVFAGPGTR